jgi:hypothetical protein
MDHGRRSQDIRRPGSTCTMPRHLGARVGPRMPPAAVLTGRHRRADGHDDHLGRRSGVPVAGPRTQKGRKDMRQRVAVILAVVGLFTAGLLVNAGAAQAADRAPVAAGASGDGATILRGCNVTPAPGVDAVNARSAPNVNASRNGIIPAGAVADADCTATAGGQYTCPRGTSTWWIRVTWPAGVTSYVAERCVSWFTD